MRPRPHLIGSYKPPAVRIGDRVSCLYRDADCKVTSWSDAPIPWPRVRALEHRGGSGLWVDDTLARAIRTESAVALMYWFGVGTKAVWRWRKAFGVSGHTVTPGSRQATTTAALKGTAASHAKQWSNTERNARGAPAKRQHRRPPPRWTAATGAWTAAQVALLGTDDDDVIGERIGRTTAAVRCKRQALKIPKFRDKRRKG